MQIVDLELDIIQPEISLDEIGQHNKEEETKASTNFSFAVDASMIE